LLADPPR